MITQREQGGEAEEGVSRQERVDWCLPNFLNGRHHYYNHPTREDKKSESQG
jgi:hypothetical protein